MSAGEHFTELRLLYPVFYLIDQFLHFLKNILILSLLTELDENLGILNLPIEPVPSLYRFLHRGPLTEDFLGLLLIVPETGAGDFRFEFLNTLPLTIYVKETPEGWRFFLRILQYVRFLP